ncbi:MAG: amino acid permease [Nanoarchaeota archaeon]|nr:amino acid permease [Nanoarchaeota archaeon]
MAKNLYQAIATLIGFTIGAGILGIPFVIAKAGFVTGIIDIVLIGIAILFINLYIGEISLRTKGSHQLTGYADKYLGKWGKGLMTFSMIFGMYGALIAYTVKEGEFLFKVFSPLFGGNQIIYSLIFLVLASILIFKGIKAVEKSELYMVLLILVIVIIFAVFALPKIVISNLSVFSPDKFFLPYGVILFAYLAMAAIPELREELNHNKKSLKKAIIIGTIIPIFIYALFALLVVGVSGPENITDGAIIGFGNVLGSHILVLGLLFGTLTMATSFIAVGLALKEMFHFDFKVNKSLSSIYVVSVPLIISIILILIRIANPFFLVLDITGVISGGLAGILVVMMHWQAKKKGQIKPEYSIKGSYILSVILILLFVYGMISELLTFF